MKVRVGVLVAAASVISCRPAPRAVLTAASAPAATFDVVFEPGEVVVRAPTRERVTTWLSQHHPDLAVRAWCWAAVMPDYRLHARLEALRRLAHDHGRAVVLSPLRRPLPAPSGCRIEIDAR